MTRQKHILHGALAVALIVAPQLAGAQVQTSDQVGLVFPALASDPPELGETSAFILKLSTQADLRMTDPITEKDGYGRGIVYFVPAAMAENTRDGAAALARLNGLQGTVWGEAVQLLDGIAIQSFLTLSPEFEDYRSDRLEYWSLDIEGVALRLGPPELHVSFIAETIPDDLVSQFKSPSTLLYCQYDGGCRSFDDYNVSRVYAISQDGKAKLRRGGIDYTVQLPRSNVLNAQVIDYASVFIAYARGNFNYTDGLAAGFIERHGRSAAALDIHLYRAAALARMERFAEARQSVDAALEINPVAKRALRYGIMVELASEPAPTDRAKAHFRTLEANFGISDAFDEAVAKLMEQ